MFFLAVLNGWFLLPMDAVLEVTTSVALESSERTILSTLLLARIMDRTTRCQGRMQGNTLSSLGYYEDGDGCSYARRPCRSSFLCISNNHMYLEI